MTRRAAHVNVAKLFSTPDCEIFLGFGWILSSTVRMGQELRVVGEAYLPDVDRPGAGIWGLWGGSDCFRMGNCCLPSGQCCTLRPKINAK